ncbi:MAG: L-lactate dehydrogenase, partial [Mycoplasmatales bacterium]
VPLWSTATIGQQMILDVVAQSNGKYDMEGLQQCFIDARDAAYKIIDGKGSTYYGIGLSLSRITKAILSDQTAILTVSAKLNGQYDECGLYVPVPAIIGGEGISQIQNLNISTQEREAFKASCKTIKEVLKDLGYNE